MEQMFIYINCVRNILLQFYLSPANKKNSAADKYTLGHNYISLRLSY